jgi:FkbM family methyltransferase
VSPAKDSLVRGLRFLRRDPTVLPSLVRGKLRKLGTLPPSPHVAEIDGVRFSFDFALSPVVSMMYRGTYQPEVETAIRRWLSPGDWMVDVGANIGYMSAIGLGVAGRSGGVIAFEPAPPYLHRLESLARLNPDRRLVIRQSAVGETSGAATLYLSTSGNPGANSLIPAAVPQRDDGIQVPIARLDHDDILMERGAAVVKIDVEGSELSVRSMEGLFSSSFRPLIVCEVTPNLYPEIRSSLEELDAWLIEHRYRATDILDQRHRVDVLALSRQQDLLFVPTD